MKRAFIVASLLVSSVALAGELENAKHDTIKKYR